MAKSENETVRLRNTTTGAVVSVSKETAANLTGFEPFSGSAADSAKKAQTAPTQPTKK